MKRNSFLHIILILIPVILFIQGCKVGVQPGKTGSLQQSGTEYPPGDPTLYAQLTNAAKSRHPVATDDAATLFAILTEGAGRNPSSTPFKTLTPTPVTPSPTITPTPYYLPKWEISPKDLNFGMLVLDYETLEFKAGYFEVHKPCQYGAPLVTDETLILKGYDILNDPYIGNSSKNYIQQVGILSLLEFYPADFGGVVIFDACNGQELFAGSIIGLGVGNKIYPIHAIEPTAFKYESGAIRQPQRFDVIAGVVTTNDLAGFGMAWNSVQSLNMVHDFADYPYNVFIYLYGPAVYAFRPSEAEWVIFLYR